MTDASRASDEHPQGPASEGVPAEDLAASFDEPQPETQANSPLDAELGEDGQGETLTPDEDAAPDHDAPTELRVQDLP